MDTSLHHPASFQIFFTLRCTISGTSLPHHARRCTVKIIASCMRWNPELLKAAWNTQNKYSLLEQHCATLFLSSAVVAYRFSSRSYPISFTFFSSSSFSKFFTALHPYSQPETRTHSLYKRFSALDWSSKKATCTLFFCPSSAPPALPSPSLSAAVTFADKIHSLVTGTCRVRSQYVHLRHATMSRSYRLLSDSVSCATLLPFFLPPCLSSKRSSRLTHQLTLYSLFLPTGILSKAIAVQSNEETRSSCS